MTLLAGALDLEAVMTDLSARRPVFHSEADFQFAFAQAITTADETVQVRLEVRQAADRAEYVDLACWTPQQRTLVEFKYATSGWSGTDPAGEQYMVRNHSAFDLARRYFVHDIHRLERFTADQVNTDGIAIMLTNQPSLWTDPAKTSRDAQFRIHQDRTLTGHLAWGTGDTPRYDQNLTGTYPLQSHDYSTVDGRNGHFRWLGVPVGGKST